MDLSMEVERKPRLVVLVPESLAGNMELARKIAWMALRYKSEVFYLTLVDNDDEMLSVSRHITTMKAITAGNCLVVQSKLAQTNLWLRTLREIYQPGDRVVCHQEQLVKNGFLKTMPITEFLHNKYEIPTITISGFYHPQQVQISQWLRTLVIWLGFLLIILSFTALEIRLDHVFQGVIEKLLLCFVVTIEIGAIWIWDSITG